MSANEIDFLKRFGGIKFDVTPSPMGGFVYHAEAWSPDRLSSSKREGTVDDPDKAFEEIHAWLKDFFEDSDDPRFDAKQWDELNEGNQGS